MKKFWAFYCLAGSHQPDIFPVGRVLQNPVNPKKIVPIHTENPEKLKQVFVKDGFSNFELWDDGIEYQL